ncbi:MAG: DUF1127 domain-containing protein [Bradyrhizobium sp.]
MTTMSQAAAQPAMSLSSSGSLRRLWNGVHAIVAYLDRRAAIKALRQLDDRELRDIGLTRSHIEFAVWGVSDPELGRLR